MGCVLSNEPERVWESAWASQETKDGLEEAQIFAERASQRRKNRHRKYFSLSLQRPATCNGFDALATRCRETVQSLVIAVEPAFSLIQCSYYLRRYRSYPHSPLNQ